MVLMLKGLKNFSNASGLTTNASKSNIFTANTGAQVLEDIFEMTGYTKRRLPFRYLGVHISSKKISIVDHEMLTEKLAGKIKIWESRYLS